MKAFPAALLKLLIAGSAAHADPSNCFVGQLNTFNATPGSAFYEATQPLVTNSYLDDSKKSLLTEALSFEQSNWAGNSAKDDPFYDPPAFNASTSHAGALLRIEHRTNTSLYTLPPALALSRILFTTQTTNGTLVPASAFVLWPYQSRRFSSANASSPNATQIPLLAWGHGTSGISREAAPSHIRTLWYQYGGPFTAALAGYAVVAPDYAGLGVDRTADGAFIPHEYVVSRAAALDMLYATRAAQAAFSRLSTSWAAFGHSQGGGAVWSLAELFHEQPELSGGYIGGMAGSPLTTIDGLLTQDPRKLGSLLATFAYGARQIVPDFDISAWLTPTGISALDLDVKVSGSGSTASVLFSAPDLVRPDWNVSSRAVDQLYAFQNKTYNGGKPFKGPMLVLCGTLDPDIVTSDRAYNETCARGFGGDGLEYMRYVGVSHVPAMFAGQMDWLDWLRDRFEGRSVAGGCKKRTIEGLLEVDAYQKEYGYFLEWVRDGFELG